jgi:ASC-1-like (ASCH) protein
MRVSFKPVRDYPERMAVVQKHLESKQQASLLREIEKGDLKCRLVWKEHAFVGIFAYRLDRSNNFQVVLFSGLPSGEFNAGGIAVEEIVTIAKEEKASTISASLLKTEQWAIDFFKDGGFKTTRDTETHAVLSKDLSLKRKRRSESPEPPPVHRPPPVAVTAPLKQPYFNQIESGQKTIEGRIASGMFLRVRQGGRIQFINGQRKVVCEVTGVRKYTSFAKMLKAEGFKKCIPNAPTEEAAVRIYDQIPSYSDKAAQFGVLAIQIKKVAPES